MQNRRRFTRPAPTRKPLPVVVVVCDDSRTAVAYFTELYSVRRGLIQNTPWNWWRVSGIMVDEVTCMETGLAAVLKMECMDATL